MFRYMVFLYFLICLPALAKYEVGDTVSDKCWDQLGGTKFCLKDAKDTVRVLLYSAGWCGPCNSEFQELVPKVREYPGVTFISLSASGWSSSSMPSQKFLGEWKSRHSIPFVVAASPRDSGKDFFSPPFYIPAVVVIDKNDRVAYKAVSPGVSALLREVDRVK